MAAPSLDHHLLVMHDRMLSRGLLQGAWGSIATLGELDALMASLDRRGVRELGLAEVKQWPARFSLPTAIATT
jgi:hypothetical protein